MSIFRKYYYPPVHFFTLWFSEAMLYNFFKHGGKFNNGAFVLDVGCGLGYHCQNVQKFNVKEAVGADISAATIDIINEFETDSKFIKLDICTDDILLYENKFDIIFSSDVYEHVHDPDLMLKNLYKLLKKGGTISITFPNWDNHGQNQLTSLHELESKLINSGFKDYKIDIIIDYSILYKLFMKLYSIVQKLSDKILRVKRVEFRGSGMPESDEFHEMYAFKKIQRLKKYKSLCVSINIIYRILGNFLKISPPYKLDSEKIDIKNKRIMLFAQK